MQACTFEDLSSICGKEPRNKSVGRFNAQAHGGQNSIREMGVIISDDGLRLGCDGGGNHVDIIRVG